MGMRLDSALKLYIGLYVVCFLLTWLVSVPMLIMVMPQSECLLFVTPYVRYGSAATCNLVGFLPILVAVCAIVLIILHLLQLRSLNSFIMERGPRHSKQYHTERPPHIFWRMVVFHGIVTLVVLVVAAILTAGYMDTCQNLHEEVSLTVRSRVRDDQWGGGQGANDHYDRFANDRSIDRYTNQNRDSYGQSAYEYGITCRNILTDPEIHSQLKQNHADNPYYRHQYIFSYDNDLADVGNIRFYAYRNNMILELCMAGAWISFALWIAIFVLMLKERHHINSHLTDESMFGSEFGGSRRGMSSRMSNASFDKMSQSRYSNYSGSQVSGSRMGNSSARGGRRGRDPYWQQQQQQHANSMNMSYQTDAAPPYVKQPTGHGATPSSSMPPLPPAAEPNSLLDYFSSKLPTEDEVDVDGALAEHDLNEGSRYPPELQDVSALDTSFELPIDMRDDGVNGGPIPLGDEVSSGRISREIPIEVDSNYPTFPDTTPMPQQNGYYPSQTPDGDRQRGRRGRLNTPQQPAPIANGGSQQRQQTGRRGPRYPTPQMQQQNSLDLDQEPVEQLASYQDPSFRGGNQFSDQSYKTHLGNQSMI